jgi:hypothetical protein
MLIPSDGVVKSVVLLMIIFLAAKVFNWLFWPWIATRILKRAHWAENQEIRKLKDELKAIQELIEKRNDNYVNDIEDEETELDHGRGSRTRVTFRLKKQLRQKGLLSKPGVSETDNTI